MRRATRASAPTPMPAVTKPIGGAAHASSSRKYRMIGAWANEKAQPTIEVKTTMARR